MRVPFCYTPNGRDKCSDDLDETAYPAVAEIMQDIPEDDEGDREQRVQQRLMRLHKNLGHPSNRLFAQALNEAKAPASVVELASQIQCPTCARYVRTAPARPANPHCARALGQIIAVGFSFHPTPSSEKLMILHFIDEASRYHTAKIIKQGRCNNYSDLGNCQASELIDATPRVVEAHGTPKLFSRRRRRAFPLRALQRILWSEIH